MADYNNAEQEHNDPESQDEWEARKAAASLELAQIVTATIGVNERKRVELRLVLKFEDGNGTVFALPWIDAGYFLEQLGVRDTRQLEGKWGKFRADQSQVYSMEKLLW